MTWGATAVSAALSVGGALYQAKQQKKEAKNLEKKEKQAAILTSDIAARKAGAKILEKTQGSTQSSYMGTYSPGSKSSLGG